MQGVSEWRSPVLEDSPDTSVIALEWLPNYLSKEGCSEDRRDILLTKLSSVTSETALDVRPPTVNLSDHTGSLRCYPLDHSGEYAERCSFW